MRMKDGYKHLGEYIRQVDIRNTDGKKENLLGVSVQKQFIPSIANTVGTDFTKYKVVKKGQFTYIPDTSRRGDKIGIALLKDYEEGLVSNVYNVFEVVDTEKLLPEYLMLWFSRPEFDRYARYKSHGSVREIFDWNEMCMVELPVPAIEEQRKIVKAYKAITDRIALKKRINDNLEAQLTTLFKEKILDNDELAVVEPLDLNIDFINGLAMQNFRPEENEEFLPVIKIRELSQGYCDNNSEFCTNKIDKSHIINKGDLVFSWSGSLQVAFWTSDRAGLNQHLFKVVSATYPQWYVYLWVRHHLLNFQRIAENKGTTFGHIKREDLHSAMIKTVDEYTIASLNKVFSPILSAYLKNAAEVHRLADVQKVLLARLSR